MRANATGGPGSVEAVAQMQMRDGENGGALLTYEADANVTGPLAGVGQRLIGSAAKRTTREFLEGLDQPDPVAASRAPPRRSGRRTFAPAPTAARGGTDPVVIALSVLAGFLLALIGVAVGRWTRPPLTPDGAGHFRRQDRRRGERDG